MFQTTNQPSIFFAGDSEPGLEVIKLEFILKLKIIALYFEFETVLKFYNLEARCFRACQISPA